jgi:hypothetical protein
VLLRPRDGHAGRHAVVQHAADAPRRRRDERGRELAVDVIAGSLHTLAVSPPGTVATVGRARRRAAHHDDERPEALLAHERLTRPGREVGDEHAGVTAVDVASASAPGASLRARPTSTSSMPSIAASSSRRATKRSRMRASSIGPSVAPRRRRPASDERVRGERPSSLGTNTTLGFVQNCPTPSVADAATARRSPRPRARARPA